MRRTFQRSASFTTLEKNRHPKLVRNSSNLWCHANTIAGNRIWHVEYLIRTEYRGLRVIKKEQRGSWPEENTSAIAIVICVHQSTDAVAASDAVHALSERSEPGSAHETIIWPSTLEMLHQLPESYFGTNQGFEYSASRR